MSERRYHFDLGNSDEGPIGYCTAVYANSEGEAVQRLQKFLSTLIRGDVEVVMKDPEGKVEYLSVYLNDMWPDEDDIDFVDEVEEEHAAA